jgi:protein phosphatase
VDRGEFSFETIIFIFLLKCIYPTSLDIIRGNHEFDFICSRNGFLEDVHLLYPTGFIYNLFIDVFDYIPLAAVLQHSFFCVHGGICPELETSQQIKKLNKPIKHYDDPLVGGLVWSDPLDGIS